jgi:DNA polymerase (family 10)
MLRKPPVPVEMEAVLQAAAEAGIAVEIDANPHSLDLDWSCCHRAQELGVMLSINPNAHRAARLVDYWHGVELARDAGICCRSILNTMSGEELRSYLTSRSK